MCLAVLVVAGAVMAVARRREPLVHSGVGPLLPFPCQPLPQALPPVAASRAGPALLQVLRR
jgi:hypothetical protein